MLIALLVAELVMLVCMCYYARTLQRQCATQLIFLQQNLERLETERSDTLSALEEHTAKLSRTFDHLPPGPPPSSAAVREARNTLKKNAEEVRRIAEEEEL